MPHLRDLAGVPGGGNFLLNLFQKKSTKLVLVSLGAYRPNFRSVASVPRNGRRFLIIVCLKVPQNIYGRAHILACLGPSRHNFVGLPSVPGDGHFVLNVL